MGSPALSQNPIYDTLDGGLEEGSNIFPMLNIECFRKDKVN